MGPKVYGVYGFDLLLQVLDEVFLAIFVLVVGQEAALGLVLELLLLPRYLLDVELDHGVWNPPVQPLVSAVVVDKVLVFWLLGLRSFCLLVLQNSTLLSFVVLLLAHVRNVFSDLADLAKLVIFAVSPHGQDVLVLQKGIWELKERDEFVLVFPVFLLLILGFALSAFSSFSSFLPCVLVTLLGPEILIWHF